MAKVLSPSRLSWPTLLALLAAVASFIFGTVMASPTEPGYFYPDAEGPGNATVATVGFYGMNVYEVSPGSNTFFFTGYVWVKWTGNETDPSASLEFNNAVEHWGLTVTNVYEKPKELADGTFLQQMKVQGRFFQPLDLKAYPLDKQRLRITIEDNSNTRDVVVYQPDVAGSGIDSTFQIPGWNLGKLGAQVLVHDYKTDFGEGSGTQLYSAVQFSMEIQRSQSLFAWKLLLPLILVLITAWLTLILHPRYVEVRTAMCATALLTTVFLQQSSLDSSQVTSLVLMDTIYVVAYILIVITFALVIWDNNQIHKFLPEEREKQMMEDEYLGEKDQATRQAAVIALRKEEEIVVRRIRKIDLIVMIAEIIIAIVVITVLAVTQSAQSGNN